MVAAALIDYLGDLTCGQGHGAGQPLQVFPWERRFLHGLYSPETSTAALTCARGAGKTSLLGAVAAAVVDPTFEDLQAPAAQVAVVAPTMTQGRLLFSAARRYLTARGHDLRRRRDWTCRNTQHGMLVEHRGTETGLQVLSAEPDSLEGLQPKLLLADEPAAWRQPDACAAVLTTALGKIPESRFVALGTRPPGPGHFFEDLLNGGADYVQVHAARKSDPPFQRRTWARACPSLPWFPHLEKRIRIEAAEARRDPVAMAAFKAKRLNLGGSLVPADVLVELEAWQACEVAELPERAGKAVYGVDLGGPSAMSAVCAYWPSTGRLEALAAFPEQPDLDERGRRDAVGNRYGRMHAAGELIRCGQFTVDVTGLLTEALARFGPPSRIAADRWREAELREALIAASVPWSVVELRGQGFQDGGEDVRHFRRRVLDRRVAAQPSLMVTSALSEATVTTDPAGNSKLAKATEGGRRKKARDDVAAAMVLAVSAGARTPDASLWFVPLTDTDHP